jgi:hypothetical protein
MSWKARREKFCRGSLLWSNKSVAGHCIQFALNWFRFARRSDVVPGLNPEKQILHSAYPTNVPFAGAPSRSVQDDTVDGRVNEAALQKWKR